MMKGKICTSIEQSKKLIALGIDVNTADMYYDCNSDDIQDKPEVAVGTVWSKDIPAWSLAALIELLPNKIVVNNEKYFLHFTKNKVEYVGIVTCNGQKSISAEADNLLDACYNIIVKLKNDDNYIHVVSEKDN